MVLFGSRTINRSLNGKISTSLENWGTRHTRANETNKERAIVGGVRAEPGHTEEILKARDRCSVLPELYSPSSGEKM